MIKVYKEIKIKSFSKPLLKNANQTVCIKLLRKRETHFFSIQTLIRLQV